MSSSLVGLGTLILWLLAGLGWFVLSVTRHKRLVYCISIVLTGLAVFESYLFFLILASERSYLP